MGAKKYDFSGWATRNDIECADGRIIRRDAFAAQDGEKVPLVYAHIHDDIHDVLGHAILENRKEGVYMYGYLNNTESGQFAKEAIAHGDLDHLSIYANHLKQSGPNVIHGVIREVSLVTAGANPLAYIDVPIMHGEEQNLDDFSGTFYMPDDFKITLRHDDMKEDNEEDTEMGDERTVKDVYDEMDEEQKKVVDYLVTAALNADADEDEDDYEDEEDYDEDDYDEEEDMKHNLFDNEYEDEVLCHEDLEEFFKNAKKSGSLKQAVEDNIMEGGVLAHGIYNADGSEATYGVADIDTLFPEHHNLNNPPDWIKRHTEWVSTVMNGVHHTPFARIKSTFANITMDEARAKGYIKGNRKKEEVFSLLRRTTDPHTVYKKQKMDRDDTIDITDFDIVAWIKSEMRIMLDEELARAFLIGDGRLPSDEDHIDTNHIRPIAYDDDLYNIKVHVTAGQDAAGTTKNMIVAFIRAMENYEGSGNLTLFMPQRWITEALLLEDGFGRPLYANITALANKMQVNKIVKVPVMKDFAYATNQTLMGVAVDLRDYNVGADKGGSINMFDDFDIDFNQLKYLIETRCSGALIKPFSALTIILGGSPATYTEATVTSSSTPKASGWYVKEGDLYLLTKDVAPVVIGQDAEEHDIYRTYYVKS